MLLGGIVALALAGCARDNCIALREELLLKDADLRDLRVQLDEAQGRWESARLESEALRSQVADPAARGLLPEQTAALYAIREVSLQFVGGLDQDDAAGDDALALFVQPRDQQGDVVKAPGAVTIELHDLALEDDARSLGVWQFDESQATEAWSSGLLASGFRFELPWQRGRPAHEELTLHVRFRTPDGRQFYKTQQVRIQLGASPAVPYDEPTEAPAPAINPAQPSESAFQHPTPERHDRPTSHAGPSHTWRPVRSPPETPSGQTYLGTH